MPEPEFFQVICKATSPDGVPLPSPVGPFTSNAEALRWVWAQPVQGSAVFDVVPLHHPVWPGVDSSNDAQETIERASWILARHAARHYSDRNLVVEDFVPFAREQVVTLLRAGFLADPAPDTLFLFLRTNYETWLLDADTPAEAVERFRVQRPGDSFRAVFRKVLTGREHQKLDPPS